MISTVSLAISFSFFIFTSFEYLLFKACFFAQTLNIAVNEKDDPERKEGAGFRPSDQEIYTNPEIEVTSKKKKNKNYTIVSSTLVSTEQRPEVKIDWVIYTKNPNNPKIRDLIIEGLSLARTQKEEFSSIIQSNDGDINALFSTLKEFIK